MTAHSADESNKPLDWRERNRREVWARRSLMWAPQREPAGIVARVDDLIAQAENWAEPVLIRYEPAIWIELMSRQRQWDYFQYYAPSPCLITFRMGFSCGEPPIEINLLG